MKGKLLLGLVLIVPLACAVESVSDDDDDGSALPAHDCTVGCTRFGDCTYVEQQCGCAPASVDECQMSESCQTEGYCCLGVTLKNCARCVLCGM